MTFKEQFPSFDIDQFSDETDNEGFTEEDNSMTIRWIKKNCLDKQKVREAIEKLISYQYEGEYESAYDISKEAYEDKTYGTNGDKFKIIDPDDLLKELGI